MHRRIASLATAGVAASTLALAAAGTAQASTTAPYIGPGSHGQGVICVQKALNVWDHAGLRVDGVDGTRTTAAIERFQREQGLRVDGVVGSKTGDLIYWIDYYRVANGSSCYRVIPTTY